MVRATLLRFYCELNMNYEVIGFLITVGANHFRLDVFSPLFDGGS